LPLRELLILVEVVVARILLGNLAVVALEL
jgi:hypothetical protein